MLYIKNAPELTSEKQRWQKYSSQVVQNKAGGEFGMSRVAHTAHLPMQFQSRYTDVKKRV